MGRVKGSKNSPGPSPRDLAPGETLAAGRSPEGLAGEHLPAGTRVTELGLRPPVSTFGGSHSAAPVAAAPIVRPMSTDALMHRNIEGGRMSIEDPKDANGDAARLESIRTGQTTEARNLAASRTSWGLDKTTPIIAPSPNMAANFRERIAF